MIWAAGLCLIQTNAQSASLSRLNRELKPFKATTLHNKSFYCINTSVSTNLVKLVADLLYLQFFFFFFVEQKSNKLKCFSWFSVIITEHRSTSQRHCEALHWIQGQIINTGKNERFVPQNNEDKADVFISKNHFLRFSLTVERRHITRVNKGPPEGLFLYSEGYRLLDFQTRFCCFKCNYPLL